MQQCNPGGVQHDSITQVLIALLCWPSSLSLSRQLSFSLAPLSPIPLRLVGALSPPVLWAVELPTLWKQRLRPSQSSFASAHTAT
eukprot:15441928-Alexandrium_andersonii.AAC.1